LPVRLSHWLRGTIEGQHQLWPKLYQCDGKLRHEVLRLAILGRGHGGEIGPRRKTPSARSVGMRRTASPFAPSAAPWTPTAIAVRPAPFASSAGSARRTSRSPQGRCSPATSCLCAPTSAPSRSFVTRSKGSRCSP
jgi:hypothetical protein